MNKALRYWNNPHLTETATRNLHEFAHRCQTLITQDWERVANRILRQNALRALIAISPDMQTS